jgi:hypothetical protein
MGANMIRFKVTAISDDIANKVRTSLRSPQYGHPAHLELATGFGPCRFCLHTFREGEEERILFTYNSFSGTDITPQPGPVFIHHKACDRYQEAGLPSDLNRLDLLLEAYNTEGKVTEFTNPVAGKAEEAIIKLLSDEKVIFIHIRNAKAGCYVARVERM